MSYSKLWVDLGKVMELKVVDDEEAEEELKKEDKEVQSILASGTEVKWKLITGKAY